MVRSDQRPSRHQFVNDEGTGQDERTQSYQVYSVSLAMCCALIDYTIIAIFSLHHYYHLSVCLMIDGMSIRKQLVYDQRLRRMEGYVDLGAGPQEGEREASEALVFMVTGRRY